VTVLASNIVTAAVVAACLNTVDATVLRRLHPAIAVAVAAVPWTDTTAIVHDIVAWRAALPAAVGCKLSRRSPSSESNKASDDADIAGLPPTLRLLDVSSCPKLTGDASFAHLLALEWLECSDTSVVAGGVSRLPPSLRELRMSDCELHEAADFSHLRALRLVECNGSTPLSPATVASLPPSLEELDIGGNFEINEWPSGGSLAHLTRLRVLCASHSSFDVPALATLPLSLHSLDLEDTELTAAASFAHLHCLRTLNVSGPDVGDAVLATLPPSLVSLDLQNAGSLTQAAVFPHLPALRVLNVSGTSIGDVAVASMPHSLVELRVVDCAKVTQCASLGHLTALRVLQTSGTDLSPAAIALCRGRECAAPAEGVVSSEKVDRLLLAALPDGRLVSGTQAGQVVLWAAIDRRAPLAEVRTGIGYSTKVRALVVLPDGHRVAIAVRGATLLMPSCIIVWDTRDGSQAERMRIRSTSLTALTALPNGYLGAGFGDGTLRVVDVDAREDDVVLATLDDHDCGAVEVLLALPDGNLATAGCGAASDEQRHRLSAVRRSAAAIAADDRLIRLWDVGAGVCAAKLVGHAKRVNSLAALPGGHLVSRSLDWTVRLWEVGSRTCIGVLPGQIRALAVLPTSNRLVTLAHKDDDKLLVWDTHDAAGAPTGTPTLRHTVEFAGAVAKALVPLPDGRLVTGGRGVRLWQLPDLAWRCGAPATN